MVSHTKVSRKYGLTILLKTISSSTKTNTESQPPLVSVEELSVIYDGQRTLNTIDFKIQNPVFLALVGNNGSGKSTLFRVLTKRSPYIGSAKLKGQEVSNLDGAAIASIVAALGQHNTLNFDTKVLDLVVMGRYRFKKPLQPFDDKDYDLAGRALKDAGISHLTDRRFFTLSGGEQQLTWLAQIAVQDCPLILLDEPTQHLDIKNTRRIFNLLKDWVLTYQKTVICITHDLHYMGDIRGYIFNISKPLPILEPIDTDSIARHIAFLESGV